MEKIEVQPKMKYTSANTNPPIECAYKDVVIIGNGPSGITLSYMLAGNWPYWNPQDVNKHPDELLRARLSFADSNKSLVEQDLVELAEGLEGRSTNPVSLLLDSLQNPCADIGLEVPSLLQYRYQPDKEVDHVVLGSGPPGGSWHRMDPNLRTLSLSAWMSLPGLDFNTWMAKQALDAKIDMINTIKTCQTTPTKITKQHTTAIQNKNGENNWWRYFSGNGNNHTDKHHIENMNAEPNALQVKLQTGNGNMVTTELVNTPVPRRVLSVRRQVSREVQTRALVCDVAQYYENYVNEMNLMRYFHNNTIVTCVKPFASAVNKRVRWLVRGIQGDGTRFAYCCRNVILANGAADLANRLGVSGEGSQDWVKHDLPALESILEQVPDDERPKMKPVLVVGAGLSAADAVSICRSSGINVIHVYRNRSAGLDKMLPETVYPEYHEVHKMMKDSVNTYSLYSPMPEHSIIEFIPGKLQSDNLSSPCHQVVLKQLNTGEIKIVDVSYCAILIGFRPDLQFLETNLQQQQQQQQCGDNTNTITTNKLSYEQEILCNNDANHIITSHAIKDSQFISMPYTLLSRKIAWLKNLCAKCKHLSICDRNNKQNLVNRHASLNRTLSALCNCTNDSKLNQHHTQQCCKYSTIKNSNDNNNNNIKITNCDMYHLFEGKDGQQLSQSDKKINVSVVVAEPKSATIPLATSMGLGEDPTKPVDCKTNPIAVDKYTNEVSNAPTKGLYAMGPLVSDNFIRFIPGGALAITSALWDAQR